MTTGRLAACAAMLALALARPAVAQTLLDFSADEVARIAAHGPWPPKPAPDASNRIEKNRAAVALGRQLFFDARLSVDGRFACASCHVPALAFQDGRRVPLSRAGAVRNTPTLLNAGAQRWLGWDGAHDSLWSASLAPLVSADEMGHDLATLAAAVGARPDWIGSWPRVFGRGLPDNPQALAVDVAKLLAAYQATLVSPRTPFDDFRDALLRGDRRAAARYPLAAQRGLRLFVGEARCHVCHAGPGFSNGEFADVGVPFFVVGGVDPGRHGGLQKLLTSPLNRLGAFNDAGAAGDPRAVTTRHVLPQHRHFGEFRVPGLRELASTAPYMHDGSLPTIEDVVRHYSELDEERLHADGERVLRRLNLSAQQAADLATFLRSLAGR